MLPQLHSLQPTSAQTQLPHMHSRNCLQAAFRRLSQNRPNAVTMPVATTTRHCQCMCHAQLLSASSLRHQKYRHFWTKRDNASFTSTSLLLHSRAHTHTQVQTDTSSSHVVVAANESETTESDSEDDIPVSSATHSSLAPTARIDEAVTGYLQSDAASETTLHRSAEEARQQVMLSRLRCHRSAVLPVTHRAAS